jgi:hypothetical protein
MVSIYIGAVLELSTGSPGRAARASASVDTAAKPPVLGLSTTESTTPPAQIFWDGLMYSRCGAFVGSVAFCSVHKAAHRWTTCRHIAPHAHRTRSFHTISQVRVPIDVQMFWEGCSMPISVTSEPRLHTRPSASRSRPSRHLSPSTAVALRAKASLCHHRRHTCLTCYYRLSAGVARDLQANWPVRVPCPSVCCALSHVSVAAAQYVSVSAVHGTCSSSIVRLNSAVAAASQRPPAIMALRHKAHQLRPVINRGCQLRPRGHRQMTCPSRTGVARAQNKTSEKPSGAPFWVLALAQPTARSHPQDFQHPQNTHLCAAIPARSCRLLLVAQASCA